MSHLHLHAGANVARAMHFRPKQSPAASWGLLTAFPKARRDDVAYGASAGVTK